MCNLEEIIVLQRSGIHEIYGFCFCFLIMIFMAGNIIINVKHTPSGSNFNHANRKKIIFTYFMRKLFSVLPPLFNENLLEIF